MKQEISTLLSLIIQKIYDKKGFNFLVLDVRNQSTLTDYLIIAEGTVDRHVQALSQTIQQELESIGLSPLYIEGQKEGDWIVLDYGTEFMIHLFIPELREKYALERIWKQGKLVDVKVNTQGKSSINSKID